MSLVGSLVSGILGSNAASDAAAAGVTGAQQAQALELKNQQAAQGFQNDVWSGTRSAEQPYQSLGATSANSLADLLKTGFHAPTLAEAQASPGYQFELQTGANAIDENAAANGTLMSGNTGAALEKFGTGLADTTYGDVYNRALQTYMGNYSTLLGGTDVGLSSTGQLASAGQAAARNMASIDLTGGEQQAQQINNAAAARASGYLGSANAWQNAIGGMTGAVNPGNVDFSGGSSPLEMAAQFFL